MNRQKLWNAATVLALLAGLVGWIALPWQACSRWPWRWRCGCR